MKHVCKQKSKQQEKDRDRIKILKSMQQMKHASKEQKIIEKIEKK